MSAPPSPLLGVSSLLNLSSSTPRSLTPSSPRWHGRRERQMHTWFIFSFLFFYKEDSKSGSARGWGEGWDQTESLSESSASLLYSSRLTRCMSVCVCPCWIAHHCTYLCVLYLAYTMCIISYLEGRFHPKCCAAGWVSACASWQQLKTLQGAGVLRKWSKYVTKSSWFCNQQEVHI